jgi:hypothetical protein
MRLSFSAAALALIATSAFAQADLSQASAVSKPWFGVHLPPTYGAEPAVRVGERPPRAALVPAGEASFDEFRGATIRKDLERIVAFSDESRATREIGSGQLWGRISGFSSGAKTVDWAVAQLRAAGITRVETQTVAQDPQASFWLPYSWEVRLLGDPAFGAGSQDVVLESAIPLPPSEIANGELVAPLVYVGTANPSVLQHIDVKGRIAVQLTVPQGHMLFERSTVTSRAQALMQRGAVAVLNLVRLPGNERSRDFSNCGGPCFNLGGRDGWFLESVLDRAAQAGLADKVRARLRLQAQSHQNLTARNGVAIIEGRSKPDEAIVIDAHADAWFDGAGDNGDGLSVMLALARHFAKPEHRLARTLVFVVSAGHHTSGLNGPRGFVHSNPELAENAVLVMNIEHVAQRNFSPARTTAEDGYRHAVADSGEAPIVIGVTNRSAALNEIIDAGAARYGTNFISEHSAMQSGESGGFQAVRAPKITIMQAPPLYHTTGEVRDVISTPGLERMARFIAYFLKGTDALGREDLLR